MAIIRWQEIAKKIKRNKVTQKTANEIIRNCYHAFKSSIDTDVNIEIKGIGSFKATWQSKASERASKAYNKPKAKYKAKLHMRKHRMWYFEKFDDYWIED